MSWIPTEAIAPGIAGFFAILTGIIAAIVARRNVKTGAREQRAPDVQEMWMQQEQDRRLRHLVEDMWWALRRAFQSYYRRVQSGGSTELTTKEQAAIDAKLPSESDAV